MGAPEGATAGYYFYPRSPQGERLGRGEVVQRMLKFLSTLSARRATRDTLHTILGGYYFYPRSPQGERP